MLSFRVIGPSRFVDARWSKGACGYCLEMICADFLAGASLHDSGNPESLLLALSRTYLLLPTSHRQEFLLRIPKAS